MLTLAIVQWVMKFVALPWNMAPFSFSEFHYHMSFQLLPNQKIKMICQIPHVYRTPAFECLTMIMTSEENGRCVNMVLSFFFFFIVYKVFHGVLAVK